MPNPSADPEFDTYAQDYDGALNEGLSVSGEDKAYFARGRIEHLARVLARLGATPARVMDYGCGTGSATPWFMKWPGVGELVGVDVSARSLDVAIAAHASARARFCLMDYHTPDASIDLVYCNGVFHHIPLPERHTAVQYIWHSLKRGGFFALFENNPWNPGTRYIMSRIPFDRDAVTLSPPTARRLVRDGGFELLRTDYLFYFPRLLKWLRPLEALGRKLPLGSQYLVLARKP
jgi:SAM-dependent methyltransferase